MAAVHYSHNRYAMTMHRTKPNQCIQQTPLMQTEDYSSHIADPLPLLPFQHTLQFPTQSIPHLPLPRPLPAPFLHPTARYHHEAYCSQRRPLPLRLADFASEAIAKAQTG